VTTLQVAEVQVETMARAAAVQVLLDFPEHPALEELERVELWLLFLTN
jgi:hypothetical protein